MIIHQPSQEAITCCLLLRQPPQTLAKLAQGIADNLLTAAVLAARIPVLLCPAMNTAMWTHVATQDNLSRLRQLGYQVVLPNCGSLACGESGDGRLADWDCVRERLLALFSAQDLLGKKVLVTAGTYPPPSLYEARCTNLDLFILSRPLNPYRSKQTHFRKDFHKQTSVSDKQ